LLVCVGVHMDWPFRFFHFSINHLRE
jgi:hypothetical protein